MLFQSYASQPVIKIFRFAFEASLNWDDVQFLCFS